MKKKQEETLTWWMLIGNEWICSPDRSFFNKNLHRARALEKRRAYFEGIIYKGTKCESVPLQKKENGHNTKTVSTVNKNVYKKRKNKKHRVGPKSQRSN